MADIEYDAFCRELGTVASGMMRVFGIRRSGQHAIIDWMLRNCGQKKSVFLNNRRVGQSPLRAGMLAAKKHDSTRNADALQAKLARKLARGQKPFVLISYESGFPVQRYPVGDVSPGFDNSDFDRDVLITRRFVNWLPSYIRLVQAQNADGAPEGLDNFKKISMEIEGYKAHLIAANSSPHVVISYDDWAERPEYRRQKLAALGLPEVDNGLGRVQPYGGGSSFSGLAKAPQVREIAARWKTLRDNAFAKPFLEIAVSDTEFVAALDARYPEDLKIIHDILA